ncbi:MAG: SoxR reducing system RseC family protein [Deltaproteobacteria bacterium]|nr:SoxR reducing system RseC family protein [Deltaproteobacteria bacterium]
MADYEGIVASQKEAGKAEVLIRPSAEGIPGASEDINCRVCHCLAQGSQVTIDALNAVGAQVGDWVLVRRDSTALLRNAMVLIGTPLLGGLMGVVPAWLFYSLGHRNSYCGTPIAGWNGDCSRYI